MIDNRNQRLTHATAAARKPRIRLACKCSGGLAVAVNHEGEAACARCMTALAVDVPAETGEWLDAKTLPGASWDTRRRQCALGTIPAKKVGNRWLVRRTDWDAFVEAEDARRRTTTQPADEETELRSRLGLRVAGSLR